MKKLICSIFLLAAALVVTPVSAKTFGWGVAAGMNISKADGGEWKTDAENGWYAGLTAKVTIPILGFGLEASALYSQESVSVATVNGNLTAAGSDEIQYLSVPIHLRYDFQLPVVSKVAVPYLFAGPQFNYALNDLKLDGDFEAYTEKFDTENASWKFDLGLGALLINHLQVSYTYSFPISNSFEASDLLGIKDDLKLSTHRIGVAWLF